MSDDTREIHPHYLDDAYFDFAEDGSEGGNWWLLFAHLVLIAATFIGWTYLHQPRSIVIDAGPYQWKVLPGVTVDEANHAFRCDIHSTNEKF